MVERRAGAQGGAHPAVARGGPAAAQAGPRRQPAGSTTILHSGIRTSLLDDVIIAAGPRAGESPASDAEVNLRRAAGASRAWATAAVGRATGANTI